MIQALGMIECRSLPTALEAADVMVKGHSIHLLGYEKSGSGAITVLISGDLKDVKKAIEEGVLAAETVGEVLSLHVIHNPHPSILSSPGLSFQSPHS